jgi:hypothetical protein
VAARSAAGASARPCGRDGRSTSGPASPSATLGVRHDLAETTAQQTDRNRLKQSPAASGAKGRRFDSCRAHHRTERRPSLAAAPNPQTAPLDLASEVVGGTLADDEAGTDLARTVGDDAHAPCVGRRSEIAGLPHDGQCSAGLNDGDARLGRERRVRLLRPRRAAERLRERDCRVRRRIEHGPQTGDVLDVAAEEDRCAADRDGKEGRRARALVRAAWSTRRDVSATAAAEQRTPLVVVESRVIPLPLAHDPATSARPGRPQRRSARRRRR